MMRELAATIIVPGWAMRRRRRALAVGTALVGVAAPLALVAYTFATGRSWVALSLDARYLGWLMLALAAALVARLVALAELWDERGRQRRPDARGWIAIGAAAIVVLPLLVGIVQIGRARASIATAFDDAPADVLFDAGADEPPAMTVADDGGPSTTTTTVAPADPVAADPPVAGGDDASPGPETTRTVAPPKPERPRSGIEPDELADVRTVLLLGADAGPGRVGLRTDTIMLFSLHEPSGRASLVSVPRNLNRLLFPPGSALEERFPYGFTNKANSVYTYVSSRPELRDAYRVDGVVPGVVALAHAIGYSLDVTIDDYVLVDMQGFLELVDALGGVTVHVPKEVPMPGNVPGAKHQYPETIGPGVIHMDGTTALGYVRSRIADTDYHRAARQRALLAALATQIAPEDVVLSFNAVADALGSALRTSLSPDELADTLVVIGAQTAIVESLGLVPPLVDVAAPDYQRLAGIVGDIRLALATGHPSGW